MVVADLLWKVFESTGNINAYLLYKDYEYVAATRQTGLANGQVSGGAWEDTVSS